MAHISVFFQLIIAAREITMKQIQAGKLQLWQFDNLSIETGINHFVTERRSYGENFTLSLSSTADKAFVRQNRTLLAEAMGIEASALFLPSQVHKTRIVNVEKDTPREDLLDTDALITATPGICIAVMSADCVPILLYDKKNRVVGAVHSGWKGTVARILEKTLHEMRDLHNTRGEDIIAGIGPSISQQVYEVGEEVIGEVTVAFGDRASLLANQKNGKAHLDLWKANLIQLKEFGVSDSKVEISSLCTLLNNDHFFSARKGDAGRFAAGIMLQNR